MKYLLVGTGKEFYNELELITAVNSANSTDFWGEVENDDGDTVIIYGNNYSFRVERNPLMEVKENFGKITVTSCTNEITPIFNGRFEKSTKPGGWQHVNFYPENGGHELVSSRSVGSYDAHVKNNDLYAQTMADVVKFCAHKLLTA